MMTRRRGDKSRGRDEYMHCSSDYIDTHLDEGKEDPSPSHHTNIDPRKYITERLPF